MKVWCWKHHPLVLCPLIMENIDTNTVFPRFLYDMITFIFLPLYYMLDYIVVHIFFRTFFGICLLTCRICGSIQLVFSSHNSAVEINHLNPTFFYEKNTFTAVPEILHQFVRVRAAKHSPKRMRVIVA